MRSIGHAVSPGFRALRGATVYGGRLHASCAVLCVHAVSPFSAHGAGAQWTMARVFTDYSKSLKSDVVYRKIHNWKGGYCMEKHISYGKLPKKKRREINRQKRSIWLGINPVTRRPESSRAYNRRKEQGWKKDSDPVFFALDIRSPCNFRYP